jgi:hypothetical protein
MKKLSLILSCVLLLSVFVAGCNHIPFEAKSKVEQQIEAMQAQHATDLRNAIQTESTQKDVIIQDQQSQLQAASDSLYGATYGFKFFVAPAPSRLDTIIDNFAIEAQAAIKTPPTYIAIVAENARLATELDETKTTLVQVEADHQKALVANAQIADEKDKQAAILVQVQKTDAAKEQTYNDQLQAKQGNLNELNNTIIAKEKAAADEVAATKALKLKLMLWCGIGALACLAGAIYSPIGKEGLIIGAATLGGATAAIPFIQEWMILVAMLVVAAILTIYFLYKHNLLSKSNVNMISAVQDSIDKGEGAITGSLAAWNTKYVKTVNGIAEVPDPTVESYIDAVLMKLGRLPAPIATGSASDLTGSVVLPSVTPTPTPKPVVTVITSATPASSSSV